MSEPTVRTEPLGGSPLARALLGRGPESEWIVQPPGSAADWRARAGDVARAGGVEWLDALRPALAAEGAAAERLARVAREGGVLITTGQQPGLFGGPIYTWSKALSALAMADAVESATGIAAAPLFWAATDDSDFAEAAQTTVAVLHGIEVLRLPKPAGPDDRMMSHVALPAMAPYLAILERGAGSGLHREVLDDAARSYREGATVGGAYVALLRSVLQPLGIAVLDAAHPAVAAAARGILGEALLRAEDVAAALAAREAEIRARAHVPQVSSVPGLSLVFQRADGVRSRIPIRQAAGIAEGAAELGANVLLRPIVERELLPTVAYMAGPGELAYFAQTTAVAAALGRPAPLALPRWSGTIIEPHVARILARHGLSIDALRDPAAPEISIARGAVPRAVSAAIGSFRERIDELAAVLGAETAARDALLPEEVIEGHRRLLHHRVDRLERRVVAAARRRESQAMSDLATARGALFPHGKRQERALNLLPILARHGPRVLDLMRERASEHAAAFVAGERATAEAHR